jgi:hypothetical protein
MAYLSLSHTCWFSEPLSLKSVAPLGAAVVTTCSSPLLRGNYYLLFFHATTLSICWYHLITWLGAKRDVTKTLTPMFS